MFSMLILWIESVWIRVDRILSRNL